jgi:hypothetical protein
VHARVTVHAPHDGGGNFVEDNSVDVIVELGEKEAAPGIVIHDRWESPRPPAITAFIWGGKVRPVPMLPYGRSAA